MRKKLTKRNRFIKKEKERKKSKRPIQKPKLTFDQIIYKIRHEILFILIMVIVASAFLYFYTKITKPLKEKEVQTQQDAKNVAQEDLLSWSVEYRKGYKLVVFDKGTIVETSIDTLKDNLKADWARMKIKLIAPDEVKKIDAKIEIKLGVFEYNNISISDSIVGARFLRKQSASAQVAKLLQDQLDVVLYRDFGDVIYLLFGIK